MCLNIGLYSYIADTSSPTNRTLRMSILTGVFSLGYVIGVQASIYNKTRQTAYDSYFNSYILKQINF